MTKLELETYTAPFAEWPDDVDPTLPKLEHPVHVNCAEWPDDEPVPCRWPVFKETKDERDD